MMLIKEKKREKKMAVEENSLFSPFFLRWNMLISFIRILLEMRLLEKCELIMAVVLLLLLSFSYSSAYLQLSYFSFQWWASRLNERRSADFQAAVASMTSQDLWCQQVYWISWKHSCMRKSRNKNCSGRPC